MALPVFGGATPVRGIGETILEIWKFDEVWDWAPAWLEDEQKWYNKPIEKKVLELKYYKKSLKKPEDERLREALDELLLEQKEENTNGSRSKGENTQRKKQKTRARGKKRHRRQTHVQKPYINHTVIIH